MEKEQIRKTKNNIRQLSVIMVFAYIIGAIVVYFTLGPIFENINLIMILFGIGWVIVFFVIILYDEYLNWKYKKTCIIIEIEYHDEELNRLRNKLHELER